MLIYTSYIALILFCFLRCLQYVLIAYSSTNCKRPWMALSVLKCRWETTHLHSPYSESGLGVAPGHQHPRPPLPANRNLFRNPNMVFESTYLCTATTKSLFPVAPGLQTSRLTETESLIDSSSLHHIHWYCMCTKFICLLACLLCISKPFEIEPSKSRQ